MGGKTKSSQRTKNNVRPSSSSRSAELLHNSSNMDPSLLSGGKMAALFPTLSTPVLDQSLPSEFSVCIKKLNKKDPVTKVKALLELNELVSNSKVDDVVLVLPSWAHFYKILAVDVDCKVREMAQLCQWSFARSCGRRLAPALRQLVPAWLQAQYDDHAPAAAHAQNALKATFPENKLPEVISFCKTEVMAHLLDTLIGNAQKSIIKPAEEAEERSLQLQRLVTSGLQGLQYLTRHLPAAHHAWLWAELAPLLLSSAHWKHADHTSPRLRAAWFAAMGRVSERFASTFADQFGARLLKVILAAAHDPPPLLAQQIWDCLLHFMHGVPDWHKYLDRKDLLTKRILNMLEKGGWGDAKRLTDMLLPLLAHLPREMLTKDFYETFFASFFKGLARKNTLSSKTERQYWISSLAECLRYLSIQQDDFVLEVITAVHRNWLEEALSTDRDGQLRTNLIKNSATNMVALVKFWLKQSQETNADIYDQLIRNFWQNVCATVLAQIEKSEGADVAHVIEGHILLLQTLKTAFSSDSKKSQSIRFDGDVSNEAEVKVPTGDVDDTTSERYNHYLNEVVEKICCNYMEYADKNDITDPVLLPLISIMNEYDSKSLYVALARHFSATSVYDFYEKVLMKWMLRDTMRSKTIVDITFMLMKHLTEQEQDAVMESFDKLGCGVVEWGVGAALCHRMWGVGSTRRWLRSRTAHAAVLAAARRLLRQRCAQARSLLLVCLSTDDSGEMLISEATASEIAEVVGDALGECLSEGQGQDEVEQRAWVAAHVGTALAARGGRARGLAPLLRGLLRLLLAVPRGDPRLSVAGWCEARSAFHDGLSASPLPARTPLAEILTGHLAAMVDDVDVLRIEHMSSLCPYLISGCSSPEDVNEVRELTKLLLDFELDRSVEVPALRHDCVVGRFNCPFDDDNDVIRAVVRDADSDEPVELTKETLVPCINKMLFRAAYLRTMLLRASTDEDEENADAAWCDTLLCDDHLQLEFCKLLREFMVLYSLDEGYGFWLHHDIIREAKIKIEAMIDDIVAATSKKVRDEILSRLLELAATEGYYWAYARRFYEVKVEGGTTSNNSLAPIGKMIDDNSEGTDNVDANEDEKLKANGNDDRDSTSESNKDDDLHENVNNTLDEESMRRMIDGKGYYHCLQANTQWRGGEAGRAAALYAACVRGAAAAFPEDAQFVRDALAAAHDQSLDPLVQLYHRQDPRLLGERDISSMSWAEVVAECGIVRVVACELRRRGWDAPSHHWDFATVTLCALLHNLARPHAARNSTKMAMVSEAAFELYVCVREFVARVRADSERRVPAPHVSALPNEWRDVFAPALTRDMYALAAALLESSSSSVSYNMAAVLSGVSAGVHAGGADWPLLDAAHRAGSLQLSALVQHCARALSRPLHPAYHCLAHTTLHALADALADHDAAALAAWDVESGTEVSRPALAPDWLHAPLSHSLLLLDALLEPYTAGVESCTMEAGSDSHHIALGCLLLADALHHLTQRAPPALAPHYAHMFRTAQYVERLLPAALRLLPAALLSAAAAPAAAPLPDHYRAWFQESPRLHVREARAESWVARLACRGVWWSVAGAGRGAARGWWGAAARGPALPRLVCAYVTAPLVRAQLRSVRARPQQIPDLEIRVLPAAGEVVAELTVEERRVELHFKFPRDFPLTPPQVTAPVPRPSVNTAWIPIYIAYQNGTVMNAIETWCGAISSHVASAPTCYVCYCRLHPASGHLPCVLCRQCRNRFHTPCLQKWFATGNRSNCPLCRSIF